jgi:hypothetical protein
LTKAAAARQEALTIFERYGAELLDEESMALTHS